MFIRKIVACSLKNFFPRLVAVVSSHSPVGQKRQPFATHETSKKMDGSSSLLVC